MSPLTRGRCGPKQCGECRCYTQGLYVALPPRLWTNAIGTEEPTRCRGPRRRIRAVELKVMTPLDSFRSLRLHQFVGTKKIDELRDWLFLGLSWTGEGYAFSTVLALPDSPDLTRCVFLDLTLGEFPQAASVLAWVHNGRECPAVLSPLRGLHGRALHVALGRMRVPPHRRRSDESSARVERQESLRLSAGHSMDRPRWARLH